MSATGERESAPGRRILAGETLATRGPIDREAQLHRRRKSAMVSLMAEFEREIEPHVTPGHRQAIENFKRSCRSKLNGLTFEAIELMSMEPGEQFNEASVDLAEQLAFDANGGQAKP